MLSAEQNDSQSEEINEIEKSQAQNRPVPVSKLKYDRKKFSCSAVLFFVLSGRSKNKLN